MRGADLDEFIQRWSQNTGGAERANYALFLTELCAALALDNPEPASADTIKNDYVFERSVRRRDGSTGRIDLYKRGCFVLEAKQSRQRRVSPAGTPNEKFVEVQGDLELQHFQGRRSANRSWDILMLNAREQAESYARDLPQDHGWPPFVIVCDVGHCFEIFADFQRMGKFDQYPDRMHFRIYLEDLRNPDVQALFRNIWTDPQALNPAARAERATRALAGNLAAVSTALEARNEKPDDVAVFLMRCLFTMFAEDMEMLPKDSFKKLLADCVENPTTFQPVVGDLWKSMDSGGFAVSIRAAVKRFKDARVLELMPSEIALLKLAADAVWTDVEPAIFGTLLARALSPKDRGKLGAYFTPRAYVERLVTATVIDPLREDWRHALAAAEERRIAGDQKGAVEILQKYHDRLCAVRVLDPACGTGNFLYVALELMKRLEGEVLEATFSLGGQVALSGLETHSVGPKQFIGIEINPRAAEIAELVLWIGYLQWHFRTRGGHPDEPIIKEFKNIYKMDAILDYERAEAAIDTTGQPVYRWDGEHKKINPVSRRMVPDLSHTVPVLQFINCSIPDWPNADFIVGNPPFIGTRRLKERQGEEYVTAIRDTHRNVVRTADYVMYWYFMGADRVANGKARRCGLITTNSIVQDYSRPVLEHFIAGDSPRTKLAYAVTNHPWIDEAEGAAVRVAMTVHTSVEDPVRPLVGEVISIGMDDAIVELSVARINSNLRNLPNVLAAGALRANRAMCSQGVIPANDGFKIFNAVDADFLKREEKVEPTMVKPYIIGNDLNDRFVQKWIVDAFDMSETNLLNERPAIHHHLKKHVYEERMQNPRAAYRNYWWLFAEPRRRMRESFVGLTRFIATPYTAQHRTFQFWPTSFIPDAMVYCIPSEDAALLGVLSSSVHLTWCRYASGTLETRPRYNSNRTFYPFPFPTPDEGTRKELGEAAEALDKFRKDRQSAHPELTLTAMYNVVEKIRVGRDLNLADQVAFDIGQVMSLIEHHDRIDKLVLKAYGWDSGMTDETILLRLIELNRTRDAEERLGIVNWLRPDFQIGAAGAETVETGEMDLANQVVAPVKPRFPSEPIEQAGAVAAVLLSAHGVISPEGMAMHFKQGKRVAPKIKSILAAFVRTGFASTTDGGSTFVARRAA
jgi:MmeI, DNA-methyltransferase domain/MmeI, N-terminal domain/MmeI, helicase spacer domain/MmeI, target recognition domain